MKQTLEAQIDELYRLPLEEFTKARNTRAKSLSGTEKKQISALVKPSLPIWVINQLFWHDAPTYNALIDAAEKLRAAHRLALSGRKADMRKPDHLHRTTVEKAFAKSIGLAEKRGVRLTDSVRETIRRTLAALPGGEAAGRLTRPPEPAGFSLLTGVKILPESKVQSPRSNVKSPKPEAREALEAKERAERKEAERKARQEQKAQEKRQREIRKAEQALKEAERRLAELKS
jgi:hypothetical protein